MKKSNEALIAEALESVEGRAALAEAMVAPIKAALDYQSIGRKILCVEPLPEGVLTSYEGGCDTVQVDVSDEGLAAAKNGKPRVKYKQGGRQWKVLRRWAGARYYYPGDGSRWSDL